jgi:hypothetical protein
MFTDNSISDGHPYMKFGHVTPLCICLFYLWTLSFRLVDELLEISKLRPRAAVGLLTGHTTLRTHLYKIGHTEGQECWLCGCDKEDSVYFVCVCPVLACKRYRIWGCMFSRPKDSEEVRVGSLLSLVANTGFGLVS